ncbi:hypothetical protein KDA82_40420, partial [Streptomyces daliensis]|nr:hypothetical protein [Streptomyces daliensis]
MPQETPRSRTEGSERALNEAYDTALLDLDGVVYAGGEAVPHAVASLEAASGRGAQDGRGTSAGRGT